MTSIIQNGPLAKLPEKAFSQIVDNLDPFSATQLCRTCPSFNAFIKSYHRYWEAVYVRLGGYLDTKIEGTYKQAALNLCCKIIKAPALQLQLVGKNSWEKYCTLTVGTEEEIHARINLLLSRLTNPSLSVLLKSANLRSDAVFALEKLGPLDPVHKPTLFLAAAEQGRFAFVRALLECEDLPRELILEGFLKVITHGHHGLVPLFDKGLILSPEEKEQAYQRAVQNGNMQTFTYMREKFGPFSDNAEKVAFLSAVGYGREGHLSMIEVLLPRINMETRTEAAKTAVQNEHAEIAIRLIYAGPLHPPSQRAYITAVAKSRAMQDVVSLLENLEHMHPTKTS